MRIRITRKNTSEKFTTEESATRMGFNRIFNDYNPFTKSKWDDATENNHVAFTADEEDFAIIAKIYTLVSDSERAAEKMQQPHNWKNDAATGSQISYLNSLGVRLENGMTKGRASQLIDAAKNDELGSVSGYYTDGSN